MTDLLEAWTSSISTTGGVTAKYFLAGTSNKTASFNYAPATDGQFVTCDATGGVVAVTLPTASSWTGLRATFEKTDASNNVTVATVEGGTVTLTGQNDSVTVYSNGTVWKNIGSST
jgi:hypothetical protein